MTVDVTLSLQDILFVIFPCFKMHLPTIYRKRTKVNHSSGNIYNLQGNIPTAHMKVHEAVVVI